MTITKKELDKNICSDPLDSSDNAIFKLLVLDKFSKFPLSPDGERKIPLYFFYEIAGGHHIPSKISYFFLNRLAKKKKIGLNRYYIFLTDKQIKKAVGLKKAGGFYGK